MGINGMTVLEASYTYSVLNTSIQLLLVLVLDSLEATRGVALGYYRTDMYRHLTRVKNVQYVGLSRILVKISVTCVHGQF